MFSASPAKRPRRESLAETISSVGRTIVSALAPGEGSSRDTSDFVEQVLKERKRTLKRHCRSAFHIIVINECVPACTCK